ncbi:MAG: pyridoxamine 5'-phosphate oxidase family protein [Rhodospirillales bacterium]|nr:pyridoxamine 5'-phosphate oxidase family protein [Rhodospirillales bacterium]MBO6787952.1 pyridoxamine 5'-phosphate oxidase family protein [Rhodospirillales bacterium]
MDREFVSDIAFTPQVKAEQEKRGSRGGYAKMEQKGGWSDRISDDLAAYLSGRDSFYLATANADGQPYIQHRGGRAGFLKVLDDRRLAFADFAGNRQYISIGNAAENPKAFIFAMDYRNRRRIKLWGKLEVVEGDDALMAELIDPEYDAKPERAFVFTVDAWDANCPQHITQRWSEDEIAPLVDAMSTRIQELEEEVARLKG